MKRVLPLLFLLFGLGCSESWTFAVFSDVGPEDAGAPPGPTLSAAVARLNQTPVELTLFAGDLICGRTLEEADTQRQFDQARDILRGLRSRLLIVPGNHDVDGARGRELFTAGCGAVPWVVQHRGWTFLGLSTEEPLSQGRIEGKQLAWLRARLAARPRQGRTVVLMHQPVWPAMTPEGGSHSLPKPELHQLLVAEGVTAVFSGHEHRFWQEEHDGVLYVIAGGAAATPWSDGRPHFAVAHAKGARLTVEMVAP